PLARRVDSGASRRLRGVGPTPRRAVRPLDRTGALASPVAMPSVTRAARRAGLLAALGAIPVALAYRFAVVYRVRAGLPRRVVPRLTPADRGLPFEDTIVRYSGGDLPAWFIPARGGARGPGIVLVHGWESNRDRTLPNAQ